MLGVDVGGGSAGLLGVRYDVEAEGSLTTRLGAVDLGDSAAWDSTDADSGIEVDRASRDRVDAHALGRAHLHNGALPVVLFDLRDRQTQRLLLVFLDRRTSHLVHPVVRRLGLESTKIRAPEQNTK